LTGHASQSGLYTNLITSGIGVGEKLTGELAAAGLDHAQLSFQGADKETNDRLGHYSGWALANRAALMPPKQGVDESIALVEEARARLKGELVIDMVVPDYYA